MCLYLFSEFLHLKDLIEAYSLNVYDAVGAFTVPVLFGKWMMANQIKTTKRTMKEIKEIIEKVVDQHSKISNGDSHQDMIDIYLNSQGPVEFCKDNITPTFLAFLPDTFVTTVEMAMWLLLYVVNNQQSQQGIYDEVQRVCGLERVSFKKRPEMPITESFIMEVFD